MSEHWLLKLLGLAWPESLLLVLDFVVTSDILKTILVPSLSELSLLSFYCCN